MLDDQKIEKEIQDKELETVSGGKASQTVHIEKEVCPQCGSKEYDTVTISEGCSKTKTYKCKQCGHEW